MPSDRIVFLDTASVDYGDLPLSHFKHLGFFKTYPRTHARQLVERARDATVLITNKCELPRSVLSRLGKLRLICVSATGTNNIDLEAARQYGIRVTNVASYSTESVVQLTFGFMIALANHLMSYTQVTQARWPKASMFTMPLFGIQELAGKTLGIIGYGTIGRRVAVVAKAFGMHVLIAKLPRRYAKTKRPLKRVSLKTLAKFSDVVSVHAPLTPKTKHLVNHQFLSQMKSGSFLINMARGDLVDEVALARILKRGHLGGAATDVLSSEPPRADHPLLRAPRLLMTPHVAWASIEARERLMAEVYQNIRAFQKGAARNLV